MTTPDLRRISNIYGKTDGVLANGVTTILSNPINSNQIYKINMLPVSGDSTEALDCTIDIFDGVNTIIYAKNIVVPAKSIVDFIVNKPLYLEEGKSLRITPQTNNKLDVTVSYEVIMSIQTTASDDITNLTATSGNNQVTLNWTAPSNPNTIPTTDYIVQYSTDNTNWTVLNDGISTTTSAVVTGLTNGTLYYFKVAASNLAGIGNYATISQVAGRVPDAPTNLVVLFGINQREISASWNAISNSDSPVLYYELEYIPGITTIKVSTSSSNNGFGTGIKFLLDEETSPSLNLNENQTYRFDLSDASNTGYDFKFSTTSNGTFGGGVELTNNVLVVGTPGQTNSYVQITIPTGTNFLHYYSSTTSGMGGSIHTSSVSNIINVGNVTNYTIKNLENSSYSVRVRGVSLVGNGSFSSTITQTRDPSVLLCLNFNSANNSQTFTDTSSYSRTATIFGGASGPSIKTNIFKYGKSSAFFPLISNNVNTPSGLTYGSGSTWNILTSDFTIESWIYTVDTPDYRGIISRDNQSNARHWQFLLYSSLENKQLAFNIWNTSSVSFLDLVDPNPMTLNTWVHVAAVRDGNTFRLYRDGIQVDSKLFSQGTGTMSTPTGPVSVGSLFDFGTYPFSGYLDDVRITTKCLYPGGFSFNPPKELP
jgi:titin